MQVLQVNLQLHLGGGEVYCAFLNRALSLIGVENHILVNRRARFWRTLTLSPDTKLIECSGASYQGHDFSKLWLISHSTLDKTLWPKSIDVWDTPVAHMPVQGRNPRAYDGHDTVFAVSGWVLDGLVQAGLPAWPNPLYGVADLAGRTSNVNVIRKSRYDWDKRKGRDRILGTFEPAIEWLRSHPRFQRRAGLTLGIVSRLTPIKQFPLLFGQLAPVLARHPDVNLEIFGAGGYASVRDLDEALRPCRRQVRFWGHQRDVTTVYGQIDYLLSGLPEKEALGLNIIEAQACGTPVIAVDAPPFTETVLHEQTGFLYRDPRLDQGADFDRLLQRIKAGPRPDPRLATDHLARFSFDAFVERLRPIVAEAQARLS